MDCFVDVCRVGAETLEVGSRTGRDTDGLHHTKSLKVSMKLKQ